MPNSKTSLRRQGRRESMPPLSSVLFWPCLTLAFLLCLNGTTNFFVQANNGETAGERVMAEVEVDVSSGSTITGDDIPVIPSDMPHAEMLASMAARFGDPSKGEGVKITKLVCEDNNEQCSELADAGECKTNPSYMNLNCRKSCELCAGQERVNPKLRLMELSQGSDMGAEQDFVDKDWPKVSAEQTSEAIKKAREYLANDTKNIDSEIMKLCRNQHSQCTIWALYGECDKNPGMMKKSCAPACHSCHFLSIEGRCPIDDDTALHIWKPGDLDAMFEKLTSEPYAAQYETQVLASPEGDKDGDNSNTMNRPWVITLENIITEEEALKLIELGAVEGYKRSSDVGRLRADGSHESSINSGRTSTNSWCLNQCYQDPTVQTVVQRLSNITGIPEINSEYLQLLRYEPEQYYQVHHDYIPFHLKRQQGPRILTMYLYLNDVEAGGGTNFDKLGITVMPKRGRALLWPSVLNEDPMKKDGRTTHQALPVEAGIKYGANAWFHLRDFKTPHREGCS